MLCVCNDHDNCTKHGTTSGIIPLMDCYHNNLLALAKARGHNDEVRVWDIERQLDLLWFQMMGIKVIY